MAALSITGSQILPDLLGDIFNGTAGVILTAGMAVYLDSTDNLVKPANAAATSSLPAAAAIGIALHGAQIGQPIEVQRGGDITLGAGAAPVVSVIYVVGVAAGAIAPAADIGGAGTFTTILGVGVAGNKLRLAIFVSNQVHA